ncbi:MAG: hypothetical protein PHE50_00120 [Dehalococcoidales bacterium]|nr:hypothetical protein [Dehalococcoidales bacterium]
MTLKSKVRETGNPFRIGKYYLIRTVTMIITGKVVRVLPSEIVLEEGAWIADTGRFSDALKSANFNEVEPFPSGEVIVGRGSLIDACIISTSPRSQK